MAIPRVFTTLHGRSQALPLTLGHTITTSPTIPLTPTILITPFRNYHFHPHKWRLQPHNPSQPKPLPRPPKRKPISTTPYITHTRARPSIFTQPERTTTERRHLRFISTKPPRQGNNALGSRLTSRRINTALSRLFSGLLIAECLFQFFIWDQEKGSGERTEEDRWRKEVVGLLFEI